MKTTVAVLGAALCLSVSAKAAPAAIVSSTQQDSISQLNYGDLLYDYAVYAGTPRYRWFVIWEFSGGSTSTDGPFTSEQEALDYIAKLYFGGYEPEGAVGFEIVEMEVEPVLEHVATFDKKADAIALADSLQNIGLYTDIRRVGFFSYSVIR